MALGNMAAGIAHEVRNPLSAIKGLARFFMEASPEGSDESRMADIMTREVLRLDKVVGDLLDFARPDVLNLTDVGLNELVERAAIWCGRIWTPAGSGLRPSCRSRRCPYGWTGTA